MNTRSISIAAVAAAITGAPMLGVAANSPALLDSCVKAFMTDLSAKSPGTFKLREAHYVDDGTAQGYLLALGSRQLSLTAHDAHDNHAVARAVCTVNSRGDVVDLRQASLFDFDE
jgi:hypothetical protein